MSECRMEIRKSSFYPLWMWSCPVCHYGENMPWRETTTLESAWSDTEAHLELHRMHGQHLEWTTVPEVRAR